MAFRDLKDRARRTLHQRMQIPAIYIAPGPAGVQTPCSIRVHTEHRAFGDMAGFDYDPAERTEAIPTVVCLVEEVSPVRGGIFSIQAGEAYAVETVMPPHGITRNCQVTRLRIVESVGLPVPEVS